MRKLLLPVILIVMILGFTGFASDNEIYLKIGEPPSGKAKNSLSFDLEQLKGIIHDMEGGENSGSVEFINQDGGVIARLCTIKDNKITWSYEVIDGKSLLVVFEKKPDYDAVFNKVKEKAEKPGFLLQYSDSQNMPVATQEITFAETADLAVTFTYPFAVSPGDILADKVSIEVENKGIVDARDVSVELILSADLQLPATPALLSENFREDMLLEGGREVIPLIKPGERLTVKCKGPLKIPADTPIGKYYLGACVDVENKVKEVNKENNKDMRILMVNLPDPKRITVLLPDTVLTYNPATYDISVVSQGFVISETKEWRKCNIKPNIFQVKHAAWMDIIWEVNTAGETITQVNSANFCKRGGPSKDVNLKVVSKGGSLTVPPSEVVLKLSDARLEYEPKEGKFRVVTNENQIVYVPSWQIAKTKPSVFQFRHQSWTDSFIEVDGIKKEVRKITGGKFGYEGGEATPLNLTVKIE